VVRNAFASLSTKQRKKRCMRAPEAFETDIRLSFIRDDV
jgi:hypothetical protein